MDLRSISEGGDNRTITKRSRFGGEEPPERRRHVSPSEWRAQQKAEGIKDAEAIKQAAEQEAKTMIAEGRTLGTATVRKSRKRAIKEVQATKVAAAKELLTAQRQNEAAKQAANAARQDRVEAEATVIQLAEVKVEVSEVSAKRVEVEKAAAAAHQDLTNTRVEMAAIAVERVQVEDAVKAAKNDLTEVKAELAVISQQKEAVARDLTRLETLIAAAKRELSEVKGRVEATFKGLKLLAGQVIGRGKTSPDAEPSLIWSTNAPPDPATRKELIRSIKPSFDELMPLSAAIAEAMEATTYQARKKLAEEAAFLSDLRADWSEAQKARLEDLRRQGDSPDPAFG